MPEDVSPKPEESKPDPVLFSKEQQERVNEIVKEAMGRAGKPARTELYTVQEKLKKTEAELARVKDERVLSPNAQLELESIHASARESAAEAQRLKQELDGARKENREAKKQQIIGRAIDKQRFVNGEIAAKLLSDSIHMAEDGTITVVDPESGLPRRNQSLNPMSVQEAAAKLAEEHPYLVRGDLLGGSGSTPSQNASNNSVDVETIFGPKSDSRLANNLAIKNYPEYKRLKTFAKSKGLIS